MKDENDELINRSNMIQAELRGYQACLQDKMAGNNDNLNRLTQEAQRLTILLIASVSECIFPHSSRGSMSGTEARPTCPKCGKELTYADKPSEYLYCPACMDIAYDVEPPHEAIGKIR